MRIKGVIDALSYKGLPPDGTTQERLFIWLCHINNCLPYKLHLSDTELYQLAEKLKGEADSSRG